MDNQFNLALFFYTHFLKYAISISTEAPAG